MTDVPEVSEDNAAAAADELAPCQRWRVSARVRTVSTHSGHVEAGSEWEAIEKLRDVVFDMCPAGSYVDRIDRIEAEVVAPKER